MEISQRIDQLIDKINTFKNGENSLKYANEIEGELIELFLDDDEVMEEATAFALYRPGGGDHLVNEMQMKPICEKLVSLLVDRLN